MLLKSLFAGGLALLLLAIGWRVLGGESAQRWLRPEASRPLNIPFENGTVRLPPVAASGASTPRALASGGPRKCTRGSQVVYTDGNCPAGMQAQALRGGTVTVINNTGGPAAAAAGTGATPPAGAHGTVHEVLDRSAEMTVQERRLQKLVGH